MTRTEGGVAGVCFKINDRQFIELVPGLKANELPAMTHIAIATDDVEKLRAMLLQRGVAVGPIADLAARRQSLVLGSHAPRSEPGGSRVRPVRPRIAPEQGGWARRLGPGAFRSGSNTRESSPPTTPPPGSSTSRPWGFARPGAAQPDGTPVLNHLRLPGTSGDYVELSYKPKPLGRAQAGTAAHISLEVPEIRAAQKVVLDRAPDAGLKEPRFGLDQRWQFNLFDPDGTRVELMQPKASAPSDRETTSRESLPQGEPSDCSWDPTQSSSYVKSATDYPRRSYSRTCRPRTT